MEETRASQLPEQAVEETLASSLPREGVDEPRIGSSIGRYLVLDVLGRGAMGIVYAAFDPELDRKVALKLLRHSDGPGGTMGRKRLIREAQSMAKLAHPNVVAVHDVGEWEGQVFVAMEFIDGLTLKQWRQAEDRTWREVLEMYTQAAAGLDAAHAAGIVHRDFKPDNCMVGADGRVRVLDFGLASATESLELGPNIDPALSAEMALTRTGAVMGTPAYMAPEQHRGLQTSARTDQFSLAVAIYEAMYDQRPYPGKNMATLAFNVLRGKLAEPDNKKRAPSWMYPTLARGLAVEPEDRWPSVAALMDELQRPIRARQGKRRALVLAGVAVAVAGVFVGSQALESRRQRLREQRREQVAQERLDGLLPELVAMVENDQETRAFAGVESFAGLDDVRNTRAVPRAWMALSSALAEHDKHDLELQSSANAFASATDEQAQQEVLLGLIGPFHQGRRWNSLRAVLADLQPRHLGRPEVVAARAAVAFVSGDFETVTLAGEGSEGWAGRVAPLARAMGTARPIDIEYWDWTEVVDLDGDGSLELITVSEDEVRVRRTDDFSLVSSIGFEPTGKRVGSGRPTGVVQRAFAFEGLNSILVHRTGPERGRPFHELIVGDKVFEGFDDLGNLTEVHGVDLDGDGALEFYGSVSYQGRRFVELHPRPDGVTFSEPDPETSALASDFDGVRSGDYDGDGKPELAVAVGPWNGYMLRILEREGDRLRTTASLEMGSVRDVFSLRDGDRDRLLVRKVDSGKNVVLFGDEKPYGPFESGLYEVAVETAGDGHALSVVAEHSPETDQGWGRAWVVDVDGDGTEELVTQADNGTGFFMLDGTWAETNAFVAVAAGNFDGDPESELIVRQGEDVYVLGQGEEPLPPLEHEAADTKGVPADLAQESEAVTRLWERGERLVAMGLGAQAISVFENLATVSETQTGRAAAILRAAELAEKERSIEDALAIYDAALMGEFDWTLARPAAELAERMHEFDRAKQLWLDAPQSESAAASKALARLESFSGEPATLVGEGGSVHESIEFVRPGAARVLSDQGLLLRVPAGTGDVLRAPLHVDGDFVSLDISGRWTRSEWGAGLVVELRRGDDVIVTAKADCYGGATGIKRVLAPGKLKSPPWPADAEDDEPFSMRLEAVGNRRLYRMQGTEGTVARMEDSIVVEPGAYELVLRAEPKTDGSPMFAEYIVHSLTIRGATIEESSADAFHDQVERAVHGEPELDGEILEAADGVERRVWAALGFERAGQRQRALNMLDGIDLDPDGDGWFELAVALREDAGRNAALLRDAVGDRYWALWVFAWRLVAYQHPGSSALEIALSGLGDLGEAAASDPEAAAMAAWWRGKAHLRRGEVERARADLEHAVSWSEQALTSESTEDLRNAHAGACRSMASLERGRGANAEAQAWDERSLNFSLSPEIARKRLQRR